MAVGGARTARALQITFDNALTIVDGQIGWDLDGIVNGKIDFDSTISGALTTSGYELKGTLTTLATGNTAVMANATSVLTLTNFVADVNNAAPGQNVTIDFSHTFVAPGVVNGVAVLDAEVSDGTGQAVFANGASSGAVAPGTDLIINWYGYISGALVAAPVNGGPLPLLNPALAAGGGSAPYGVYSQGPQPMGFFAPVVGGHLEFVLGAARSQLLLPNSAQVGFYAIPEPASWALMVTAGLALPWVRRRARSR